MRLAGEKPPYIHVFSQELKTLDAAGILAALNSNRPIKTNGPSRKPAMCS